jgi:PAS domain S-box-containing protein
LITQGRAGGAFTLVSVDPDRRYGLEDLALAEYLIGPCLEWSESRQLIRQIEQAKTCIEARQRETDEARAYARALFSGVSDALLILDDQGRYLDLNPAATALLGYAREEIGQLRVNDLPVIGPGWTTEDRERFVRDGTWFGSAQIQRKDGSLVPLEVRVTPLVPPAGTLYLVSLRDISARRALDCIQRDVAALAAQELKVLSPTVRSFVTHARALGSGGPRQRRTTEG